MPPLRPAYVIAKVSAKFRSIWCVSISQEHAEYQKGIYLLYLNISFNLYQRLSQGFHLRGGDRGKSAGKAENSCQPAMIGPVLSFAPVREGTINWKYHKLNKALEFLLFLHPDIASALRMNPP